MTGASSRRKGYAAENEVVKYLRVSGFPYCERRAPGTDGADITGCPGIAWEVKNQAKLDLAGWVDQAQAQRRHVNAIYGPVIHKRRGCVNVGDWYVTIPADQFLALLEEAGYAAPVGESVQLYQQKVRSIQEARARKEGA